MKSLAARLRRAEGALEHCPICGKWPTRLVARYGPGEPLWGQTEPAKSCPDCGRQPELITLLLHVHERPPPKEERGETQTEELFPKRHGHGSAGGRS